MSELQPASLPQLRTPLESWLDTRLTSECYQAVYGSDPTEAELVLSHATAYPLRREGILTVRDLYIIGMTATTHLGLVGKQVYKEIKSALNDNEFDMKWKPEPAMEDIAELATDLTQVPAWVVSRSDLLTASTKQIKAINRSGLTGLTIQAVLDATTDLPLSPNLFHYFGDDARLDARQLNSQNRIRTAATEFAGKYAVAKLIQ